MPNTDHTSLALPQQSEHNASYRTYTLGARVIHPYNNANLLLWDRGELKVQILLPNNTRPMAYCDGTEEDEQELHQIAESEGTGLPTIHRRVLKTGREIWTIGEASTANDEDDVWSYD